MFCGQPLRLLGLPLKVGELTSQRLRYHARNVRAIEQLVTRPTTGAIALKDPPFRSLKRGCHAENAEVLVHCLD